MQQFENLKQQNLWLKDERETAVQQLNDTRLKLDEETKLKSEAVHQLEMLKSRSDASFSQMSFKLDQITQENQDLHRKQSLHESALSSIQKHAKQLEQELSTYASKSSKLESELLLCQKEANLLRQQLKDLKAENSHFFTNEERTKKLVEQNCQLKETLSKAQKTVK